MATRRRRRRPAKKHTALLNRARPYYERMLEEQGGGCAICGRRPNPKRRLDIDHHHGDMRVRGLLCVPCNRALRDWMTLMWFQSATQYLENPPADWVNDLL